ncbi:transporter particle component [Zalerion maritima]|uniref:Transporter particle component n=1 Tax=Zalerion maritima TaxID=339359 RepID=A0AAD5WV57_9PEZI|nr:transporter particle component [Zalerion maritima]
MTFQPVMPPYNSSDPSASFVGSSCLDFLLIEMVPMAYRVANELETQALDAATYAVSPSNAATLAGGPVTSPPPGIGGATGGGSMKSGAGTYGGASSTAGATGATGTRKMDEEEERDAVFYRLEMLGYRVGQGLAERFSRDRPRFNDTLDIIKFLCKDLWIAVFRKQVDNLRTNHRGVYVLTDNTFRPLQRMSTEAGGQAVTRAQPFLWFPCGVVRGALAAMGIHATVHAESTELPSAIFQIKTIPGSTQQ